MKTIATKSETLETTKEDWKSFCKAKELLRSQGFAHADHSIYIEDFMGDEGAIAIQIGLLDGLLAARCIESQILAQEGGWMENLSFQQFQAFVDNIRMTNRVFREAAED